jgi:hypothetical protein
VTGLNETAIDNQLHDARESMLDMFDGSDTITEEQAMALMRYAYGKGYVDAVREPDRKTRHRVAEALGLLDTETGEIR